MKKLYTTVLMALFTMGAFSQTASEIEMMQMAFGLEKMQLVAAYVNPGDEFRETVIGLYEEYEEQRMELGKERIELLNHYAENWDGMTNEQADEWMKKVLNLSKRNDKLIKKYYKKVKKSSNAIIATQFYQIEMYILTTIRYALYDSIPFVGEE